MLKKKKRTINIVYILVLNIQYCMPAHTHWKGNLSERIMIRVCIMNNIQHILHAYTIRTTHIILTYKLYIKKHFVIS